MITLKLIKEGWELSGRNVAASMTVDKVNWMMREIELLTRVADACILVDRTRPQLSRPVIMEQVRAWQESRNTTTMLKDERMVGPEELVGPSE
jgi:hypothetical protein